MFRFVVRHLRWLTRVPGAPQCFDAILLVWTALWNGPRLAAMEALEAEALRQPGLNLRLHRLGGLEFHFGGREIAHLHGNGLLDVLLNRQESRRAVSAGEAEPHHLFPDSAWVSFWLNRESDVSGALGLLATAAKSQRAEAVMDFSR